MVLFMASAACRAEEVLWNDVRLGLYYVQYHVDADDISGPYVPPGVNLRLEDVATLYVAYVRRLSSHFSAELALGVPPLTKTVGVGPPALGSVPYNGQVISTARWFAPTLLFEYNFLDESSRLRPFIGLGINYTKFYDRQSTAAGNAASGGPTSISLPVSVGPAATAGLSYRLSSRFALHASYSISKVSSELTADTAGVIRTTHIDFNPRVLVVSASYAF
jgi:outer membrane protein